MINFENIYKNHLNTKEVSDDNLKKFTEDHIERIIANNGLGTFNVMLADTTNKYTLYFGKMSSELIATNVQQSLTGSVDIILKNFKDDASRYEGSVKAKYTETSPVYQEFYPLGVTQYRQSNKANAQLLMTALAAAFTAHAADFDPLIVALFQGYPVNFQAGRTAQLLKIGEVSTDKVGTATTRDALEIQLLKNIFEVGLNFPANVPQCMAFWNQSIIDRHVDTDHDGLGQVQGIARKGGVPVSGVIIEIMGTNYKKRHTATDGSYRSSKVEAPKQYQVTATYPTGEVVTQTILITDEGITALDFDTP